MAEFSDFIIYADESGSPSLEGIDPSYPIFVLSFLLLEKKAYLNDVVPSLQRLKFDFVGHDQIVFHERDIRRQSGAFAFLQTDAKVRQAFLDRVNDIVDALDVSVVSAVIDKRKLKERYSDPWSPYLLALHFCMEKSLSFLRENEQEGKRIHVVFEGRGKKEDAELELTFRRIADNDGHWGYKRPNFKLLEWEPIFASKQTNSAGLQLADLFARPIGLHYLRPNQPNRAFDIIEPKQIFPGYKGFP